jgi:Response regulator receiver domain
MRQSPFKGKETDTWRGQSVLQTKVSPMNAEANRISSGGPPDPSVRYGDAATAASRRLARIPVVDDDPSIQQTLRNYLEYHDMRVVSALQRQDVIRQFAVGDPNVVILELRLGPENGLDLLHEIRSRPDVPICGGAQ